MCGVQSVYCVGVGVWGVCIPQCIVHLLPQSHMDLESHRSVET